MIPIVRGVSLRASASASASAGAGASRPAYAVRRESTTTARSGAGRTRRRRVVVTGMGAITPLGNTLTESWESLLRLESGVTTVREALEWQRRGGAIASDEALRRELEVAERLPCRVAAPVRVTEDALREVCGKSYRTTPRFVQLALHAGREAMKQSGLSEWIGDDGGPVSTDPQHVGRRHRIGTCIGSSTSSVREISSGSEVLFFGGTSGGARYGYRKISPHFVPRVLSNSASGRLSIRYGMSGPNATPSTACAAASHAIGDAAGYILSGKADAMLCGGTEAAVDVLSLTGFSRLRALSTKHNDDPASASRPFDEDRDGFVMGEGACVLVLEDYDHALRRGAPNVLAEVVGYGLTGDAHHITSPDPDGCGAERAMNMALEEYSNNICNDDDDNAITEASSSDAGYVNAHATSTPKGDEIEAAAIDRVLTAGSRPPLGDRVFVSSTKGSTGHLMGAAGGIEAAFAVLSLAEQKIPPTLNLRNCSHPIENGSFQYVRNEVISPNNLTLAMSNSFGFGGTNASLLFRRLP